eukprot:Rhum_TRINITY_DN2415_c0_g1::Rhum_TRINITY_DN2415_c0_g1_i1::g.7153::m.7153
MPALETKTPLFPSMHSMKGSPVARAGSPFGRPSDPTWVERARVAMKVKAKFKGKMGMDDCVAPEQLLQLEHIFREKPGQELDEAEFIREFGSVMGQDLKPEDLRLWFMRIDANANGSVDWDEFSSHLLYQHKESGDNPRNTEYVQSTLQPEPRATCHHKQPTCRVRVNARTGHYWTVSQDNVVKIWSPSTLRPLCTINNNAALAGASASNRSVMATDLCFGNHGLHTYVATVDKTINVYSNRGVHIRRYLGRKIVNELKPKGSGGSIGGGLEKDKARLAALGSGTEQGSLP